ncbi:enoyl-CoA hydratase/isomerase family protein [Ramlibacter sp. AW1]|uniref:Enoyl-CoA hydratase/isomerase family protein n=1 Tax=Ramlibacter aurantiacus TaxID=2801330 RepID=A0A936ZC25_9BURK|nr:3-hydroxyacyl-CoA dehydrogenase NAD-binding domain-containing protein [Ramlibacter aurantiacus]MBL0418809.1 enoyl-CoA hydratase/isomerase family protein [Ramlibacter aurantiacus]
MTAQYQVHADVAVITLNNPPVNGLGLETRRGVAAGLQQANADPQVKAVVLTGAGRAFSGGADIREFDSPKALTEPILLSLIAALENSDKPVVAAVHSVAMGGGLELALGAHYRIAAPGCSIALPEVKLGLIPGAGGTQRLPRVLGVETALNMIVTGEAAKSEVLARLPGQQLFDRLAASRESLMDEAMELARSVADMRPLPRIRDLPCGHPQGEAFFQFARNTAKAMAPHFPAPPRCIDAVEAATRGPFDEGLRRERETFLNLMLTPESRALRHVFAAERAASRIPDVPDDTPLRPVASVGIVGAGTMGSGIAMAFLNADLPVTLLETRPEALERGVAGIRKAYEGQVKKGRLTGEQQARRLDLLKPTLQLADLRGCDLLIEAVFEDMDVKRQVFEQLDATAKPGAILASNTSTLDLNRIASFTSRPQDVVGLHFFSPAHVMKLLEVVRGEQTAKDVLATVMKLARTLRKTAVVAGVCDGFIGNRMLEPYFRQANLLLDEGATPQQIDRAIEAFGFAMGPFRVSDMAGNDIAWAVRKRHRTERPQQPASVVADRLCELGRFGQKTGAGWYDYAAGSRDAVPSPLVAQLIEDHRREQGLERRRIEDAEIVQRLVFALVNEGARLLHEGIAARASDIDVVYLTGYGFPLHRGGPMKYADTVGLFNVVQAMQRFARNPRAEPAFWQPAPLLLRLLAEGRTFN